MSNIDTRIHVLQVSKSNGGVGTYTKRLVEALDKRRFKVTVICLSTDSEKLALELSQIEGVTALSFPMNEYSIDFFSDIIVIYKLFIFIRSGKFDIIHAHTSKPGFFTRLAAIGSNIPIIYRPANFSFYDGVSTWKIIIYAFLERFAAKYLTDKIVMVSKGERELARRYNVGEDNQFVLIYTGINPALYNLDKELLSVREIHSIPNKSFLVGTVARITEDKSPFDFVEAAFIVHSHYPDVHFLWVGEGPLSPKLKSRIVELGLEKVFHLVGSQTNIPAYLKIMDCFVLTSTSEALSIAMLEAMASGLPVISTKVNGADEAIQNGYSGLLIPIGGVQELVVAIENLINDPLLAEKLGDNARICVREKFSLERMVYEVEELYEKVFTEKRTI